MCVYVCVYVCVCVSSFFKYSHGCLILLVLLSLFLQQDDVGYVKKKREYKKRKHKHSMNQQNVITSRPQLPHYTEEVHSETAFSSEEDGISPVRFHLHLYAQRACCLSACLDYKKEHSVVSVPMTTKS